MSIALFAAGILLVVSAVNQTQSQLVTLLRGDLLGNKDAQGTYLQWALALFLVGAIGYVPRAKPFSVALMALILVAIFLRRGAGFFDQLAKSFGLEVKHGE